MRGTAPATGTRVYVLKPSIDRVVVGTVVDWWGYGQRDKAFGHEGLVQGDDHASLIGVNLFEVELVANPAREI